MLCCDEPPSCRRARRYSISSACLAVKLALLLREGCAHTSVSTVHGCAHAQTCSVASILSIFHRTFIHPLWLVVQGGGCRLMRVCFDIARWVHILITITCEIYNELFMSIVNVLHFSMTVTEFPRRNGCLVLWPWSTSHRGPYSTLCIDVMRKPLSLS